MKMAKIFISKFLIICLLISGINSFLVVRNVTVSSDILRESFLSEIRNNNDIPEIRTEDLNQYDPKRCIQSLKELSALKSREGVQFFDAWGKIPSGIQSHNLYDVGIFDQCVQTTVTLSDAAIDDVSGQFCFAGLHLTNASLMHTEPMNNLFVKIGICVPNTCSPELIQSILKKSLQSSGILSDVSVLECTNGQSPPLKIIHIVGILFFSTVAALMIASTGYEFYMNYSDKQPIPILLTFSILTNGKKLFAINIKKSPNSIDCLTGLRVLSMLWIIDHHAHLITTYIPAVNAVVYSYSAKNSILTVIARNAAVSVDTFFFMSGLLVAWAGFKALDKTNGKLDVIMKNVHRYIRLTPAVIAVLIFNLSLNEFFYTGPFREAVLAKNKCDSTNWWPILMYLQNYIVMPNNCLDETWYLAVDFHLYLISPLLLIMMWKYGKKCAPVLLILALTSIAYVMSVFFKKGYTGLLVGTNYDEWTFTIIPTHARIASWLVGFALGYFMHINQNKTFQIPQKIQIAAWIASFTTLVLIVCGNYLIIDDDGRSTNFIATMYESWKRVLWATSLAWIAFACHFGFGGIVNAFLSHPLWQPLARLGYTLYLVHMTVLRINLGSVRLPVYVSGFSSLLSFWSGFGVSLFFAIFLALGFELPILLLEKFIFHKEKLAEKKEK